VKKEWTMMTKRSSLLQVKQSDTACLSRSIGFKAIAHVALLAYIDMARH